MSALARHVVELEDIVGGAARHLADRLAEAPGWDARFSILEEFLGGRLAEGRDPPDGIGWAWQVLEQSHGRMPLARIRDELGWSAKRLIARFREHTGLTPKAVARLFRFRRAVSVVDSGKHVRWADVAHNCGYADQAHLIRDFHQFAGSAPGDFLTRRLPDAGGVAGD
jgi:AraC-like DNA-binding protein